MVASPSLRGRPEVREGIATVLGEAGERRRATSSRAGDVPVVASGGPCDGIVAPLPIVAGDPSPPTARYRS